MDSSEKSSNGFSLVGRCPAQDKCLIGPLMHDAGFDWEQPCPYYQGANMIERILHVYCDIGPEEATPVCPNCKDPNIFHKQSSIVGLWLCKNCGFYFIPDKIDLSAHIDRQGFTIPVKCHCNKRGWVILPNKTTIDNMTWKCSRCGCESLIVNIVDPT